jgi:hypothetical protein
MKSSASNGATPRNTSFRLKHFFLRGTGGVVAPRSWHDGCGIFVQLNARNDDAWRKPAISRTKLPPREAGENVGDDLTKAEASEKIDDLQRETGRGKGRRRPGTRMAG